MYINVSRDVLAAGYELRMIGSYTAASRLLWKGLSMLPRQIQGLTSLETLMVFAFLLAPFVILVVSIIGQDALRWFHEMRLKSRINRGVMSQTHQDN